MFLFKSIVYPPPFSEGTDRGHRRNTLVCSPDVFYERIHHECMPFDLHIALHMSHELTVQSEQLHQQR